ncbi:MAG: hypothetical protein IJ944_00380 [Clostridia bacterium]|nr:hypothetical protein [Clostridia bacterium]
MKKVLSFLILFVILTSTFIFSASATKSAVFAGSTSTCKPGDEVIVSFAVNENSNIAAADFLIEYDSSIFSYVDYELGDAFKGGLIAENDTSDGIILAYIKEPAAKKGGIMFSLVFQSSVAAVKGGKHSIDLKVKNITDDEYNDITVNNTSATVTIGDKTTAPVVQTPKFTSSTSSKTESSSQVSSKIPSSVVSSTITTESSTIVSKGEESYHHLLQFVTNTDETKTDTDVIESVDDNKFLFTTVIVLSALAVSMLTIMVILIIKSYSINQKEK